VPKSSAQKVNVPVASPVFSSTILSLHLHSAKQLRELKAKTMKIAASLFMMPQVYHTAGGRGSTTPPSGCVARGKAAKVQEAGCGARVKGAVHAIACKGAGSRVRGTG